MNSLNIIETLITQETQLVILYAKVKISNQFSKSDEDTLIEADNLIKSVNVLMNQS
jgi:hypothetical protein